MKCTAGMDLNWPFNGETRQVSLLMIFFKDLRQHIPPMVVKAEKKIDFVALCNDLIDYFIVCFEHQCNTMRA